MSIIKKTSKDRRFSFSHVNAELHTSTHVKSSLYALQHHEEYESKMLPINANSLNFDPQINNHLISCLYIEKNSTSNPSTEFKANLVNFYVYLTIYILIFISFSIVLYNNGNLSSKHLYIHLICLISLLLLSYFILLLVLKKKRFLLINRQLFLGLSFCIICYLVLTDERILCSFTGETYNENHLPLIIWIITLIPMLILVLFDYFFYTLIISMFTIFMYLSFQLIFSPLSKYTTICEISLITFFLLLQIVDTHKIDLRVRHVF